MKKTRPGIAQPPSRGRKTTSIAVLLIGFPFFVFLLAADRDQQPPPAEPSPQWGPDLVVETNTANTTKSKNLDSVQTFLRNGEYLGWSHDPYIRPTGDIYHDPEGSLIDGMTHHRVRIYYSPSVAQWLKAGSPKEQELPDRSMIVKEMYKTEPPIYPNKDPVIGWAAMVKKNGASHDGWYWVIYFKEKFRSMETMGTFNYSFCLTCHASTKNQNTFASALNLTGENADEIDGRSIIDVADPLFMKNLLAAPEGGSGNMPREAIDPEFKKLYSDPGIYRQRKAPSYQAESTGPKFPSSDFDHVWNREDPKDRSYMTSDNCIGCHDATLLVETQTPNMLIRQHLSDPLTGEDGNRQLNLSVYGEWRASPMGMAGRDPIFFAQLESEIKTYPEKAGYIQNLCLSCHGAMGQRQYQADRNRKDKHGIYRNPYFEIPMVFKTEGPHAKYGALARDGISCMICHQMDPDSVYTANTGHFDRAKWDIIYGSTGPLEDPGGPIRPYPMEHALGITPTFNKTIKSAHLCGTCHTIELPVEKPGVDRFHASDPVTNDGTVLMSEAHEQDTFLEWLYSGYQNANPDIPVNKATARTCQDCHMNPRLQNNGPIRAKVANVENENWPIPKAQNLGPAEEITVPNRPHSGRHTLFGMNLFVLTFYQQFGNSMFGIEKDTNPPAGTVSSQDFAVENGEWQIKHRTASVKILDVKHEKEDLVANVRVTNRAGHRLPSGVGFRRAWIEFRVLDDRGRQLWGSGVTDSQGVIVRPDGKPLKSEFTDQWKHLQPHWKVITRQNQVQIYEERYVNEYPEGLRLDTSFLGIGLVTKDNRLQPRGYQYDYLHRQYVAAVNDGKDERRIEKFESLLPASHWEKLPRGAADPNDDVDYRNGSGADEVTYRIPMNEVKGAAVVTAQLNYQNIPPYYLRDRFQIGAGGPQTQRLYYLVGHTKVENTAIDGWTIKITGDTSPVPQRARK